MKSIYLFSIVSILFTLVSCEKDSQNNLKLELKSDENIEISNPDFILSVYGFDPNYMDVPASLITSKSFKTDKLPFTLTVDLPENPEEKIKYLHSKEYARYYVSITWDSDGNGKICRGDISIDFNTKFPDVELKESPQTIYLDQIPETTPCN